LIIIIIYYYKYRKVQSYILTEEEMQKKFGLVKMDVFISYCWAQQEIAKKLKQRLDETNIKSLMDIEQMITEKKIDTSMEEVIINTTLILVLISNEYAESINCNKEVKLAVTTKKQIIPLLVGSLDSYPPQTMKTALKDKLYIDITTNFDFNVSKVIDMIKDYLKKTSSKSSEKAVKMLNSKKIAESFLLNSFIWTWVLSRKSDTNCMFKDLLQSFLSERRTFHVHFGSNILSKFGSVFFHERFRLWWFSGRIISQVNFGSNNDCLGRNAMMFKLRNPLSLDVFVRTWIDHRKNK